MGRIASERLAQAMADDPAPRPLPPLRLNTRPLGAPLVVLEDKDALWSALDRDEP